MKNKAIDRKGCHQIALYERDIARIFPGKPHDTYSFEGTAEPYKHTMIYAFKH